MCEMNQPFQGLWDEFEQLDVTDDRMLLAWFRDVFTAASEQRVFVPFRSLPIIQRLNQASPSVNDPGRVTEERVAAKDVVRGCVAALTQARNESPRQLYRSCLKQLNDFLETSNNSL